MAENPNSVAPTAPGPVGPAAAARRGSQDRLPELASERRPSGDPFDVEGALSRLAQLLDTDRGTPRQDVPRGFYLNILV